MAFTSVMAEKGVKVVLPIRALFYADDPLFIPLSHEVVLEDMMELPCDILEVGVA